jgi:hypothetical protein
MAQNERLILGLAIDYCTLIFPVLVGYVQVPLNASNCLKAKWNQIAVRYSPA